MKRQTLVFGAIVMLFSFAGFSCTRYDTNPAEVPDPENDEALVDSSVSEPTDAEGDTDHIAPATKQIVLAGGCFWCVEAVYQQLDGVTEVVSGYAGGDAATANYNEVKTGRTKHAEVVRITYDPSKITLGTILKVFFSTAHDPTTLNKQGNDRGPQYRSAVFYDNDQQKQIASDYIKLLNDSGVFSSPIVTTLEPLTKFYLAESYHQDYAKLNPTNGYIQNVSEPKVNKTKQAYPELLREDD